MSLAYSISGKGIPVVLLHGFCEDKTLWRGIENDLNDNFMVISIDLPGFGQSDNVALEPSIEYFAEQVDITLQSLNVHSSILIGHSMGGYTAIAYAELFPEKLKGIGFLNSSVFADTDEKKHARNKTITFLENNTQDDFIVPFVPGLFYPKNRPKLQKSIARLIDIGLNAPKEGIINAAKAMRDRTNRADILSSLVCPVMYVIGKEDQAINLETSIAQCSLAKRSYTLFLGETAHMGMLEAEKECRSFFKYFVNECTNN